jgi:periplasmic divalent cation tolerance protein
MASNFSDNDSFCIVLVTVDSPEDGLRIARDIVGRKLAACVNVIPELTSVYEWEGRVQESFEALLMIKTRKTYLDKLTRRILELHTYEVPEIIAFDISGGHNDYIKWLDSVLEISEDREDVR